MIVRRSLLVLLLNLLLCVSSRRLEGRYGGGGASVATDSKYGGGEAIVATDSKYSDSEESGGFDGRYSGYGGGEVSVESDGGDSGSEANVGGGDSLYSGYGGGEASAESDGGDGGSEASVGGGGSDSRYSGYGGGEENIEKDGGSEGSDGAGEGNGGGGGRYGGNGGSDNRHGAVHNDGSGGPTHLRVDEEPAAHNLHVSSTASHVILERKREGTLKGAKGKGSKGDKSKGDKSKGDKSKGSGKDKKSKGDKSTKSKSFKYSLAPTITPAPSITPNPTMQSESPSALPTITNSPTDLASSSPSSEAATGGSATDSLTPIPSVHRLIPAFWIEYTTSQGATPSENDYLELAEATREYLHASLYAFFDNIDHVKYLGTETEFYYARHTYLIEYQFKTKWVTGRTQVPSIPELNVVVEQLFGARSAYVAQLNMVLPEFNVFSSTTVAALSDRSQAPPTKAPVNDSGPTGGGPTDGGTTGGTATASETPLEDEPSNNRTTMKIVVPVVAVCSLSVVALLAVYFRRQAKQRVEADSAEGGDGKPADDISMEKTPMISPHGDLADDLTENLTLHTTQMISANGDLADSVAENTESDTPLEIVTTKKKRKSKKKKGLVSSSPPQEELQDPPLTEV